MKRTIKYPLLNIIILLIGITTNSNILAKAPISNIETNNSFEDRISQLERIYDTHSQLLIQLQQKLLENQTDIDSLYGHFQENQHKLDQITECQKKIQIQIDNLNIDKNNQRNCSNKNNATSNIVRNTNAPTAKNEICNIYYDKIIAIIRDKSRQNEAIAAFEDFVQNYPNSMYQPNANYWLGQLNYNKGEKKNRFIILPM